MSTTNTTTNLDGAERRRSRSGDETRYGHILHEFQSRAWALHLPTLAVIQDMLRYRSLGHRLSREEVEARIMAGQERSAAVRSGGIARGGVAVVALYGIVAQRAAAFDSVSSPGGTSVEQFTQMLRTALADDSVESILIEIDSPGGSVDGIPELAAELRNARGQKPLVAVANTLAASAAYWIASQCDELVVTPSGEVGSIGVYAAHQDFSAQLEQDGVKMTLISAGKYKTEGNPWEPLSEEAQVALQAQVDDFYGMFVADVSKGRGVPVGQVREGFGQGRTVLAKDAVAEGMADRVDTFDNTLARMLRGGAQPRRRGEVSSVPMSGEFHERLSAEWSDPLQIRIEDGELVLRVPGSPDEPELETEDLADQVGETEGPGTPARALDPDAAARLLSQPGFRRAYQPTKEEA